MLQEPHRIEGDITKRSVFRLFHQVWNALSPTEGGWEDDDAGHHPQTIAHGLAALPAIERMVLLLTALEGFSSADTAFIVNLSEDEVREALSTARDEVLLQASVDVLIIEDEPVIAMELSRIVEEMGHKVCGTAAREQEALSVAMNCKPALVLADISLKDGDSGISAVQMILEELKMPIIFVTGYPERLLTGNALEPAFVISKPFDPEGLKIAIGQALTVTSTGARERREEVVASA
jgi:CheY-like chemotaxis protein